MKRTCRRRSNNPWLNLLALNALGLLNRDEALEIEEHIAQGCAACEQQLSEFRSAVDDIALASPTVPTSDELRARVVAFAHGHPRENQVGDDSQPEVQVWKGWIASTSGDTQILRATEGQWQEVVPGVWAKSLYVDAPNDTVTMLIRMDAGAKYLPHRHAGPELCYVLKGDLREGNSVIMAGDFQASPAGSVHGEQYTNSGCLLLITCSSRDELLGDEANAR